MSSLSLAVVDKFGLEILAYNEFVAASPTQDRDAVMLTVLSVFRQEGVSNRWMTPYAQR